MTRSIISRLALNGAASATAMAICMSVAHAQAMDFDIEAQPLSSALLEFNEQAGVIVMASGDLVEGKFSQAIKGSMDPEDALDKILTGSGLKAADAPNGAYTITLASADAGRQTRAPFRVAQLDQETARVVETVSDRRSEESRQERDTIVVTGTNIRGVQNPTSPVSVFDREDFRLSGAATTQDFIRTLPQNLDLSENINTGLAGQQTSSLETAAGVNLRGLGGSATLTLVNGRRLAPGDSSGRFVDISLIPISAVERLEVLTDGASAIYGADAVAGVVNLVLRDDYEGAETQVRVGTATRGRGSPKEFQATQTVGAAWDGGNIMASYEYNRRNNLDARDREFTETAPSPADLLANQQRHSVLVTGSQDLTENIEVFATGIFATREAVTDKLDTFTGRPRINDAEDDQISASLGGAYTFENDWRVDFSGGYSRKKTDILIGDGSNLDFEIDTDFSIWAVDLVADGALFEIPGGSVRAAIGGQFRREALTANTLTVQVDSLNVVDRSRDVYAVFAEVNLPIVGKANRRPGVYALDISAAGRFEDFSDAGSSANPKVGLRYAPFEGLSLRGTYSTAFQAPAFVDIGRAQINGAFPGAFFPQPPGAAAPNPDVIFLTGGSTDLGPEESRNFTAGFDYEPGFAPGARVSLTYFNIDFEGRVGVPGSGVFAIFTDPDSFGDALTFNADPATVAALFAEPGFRNDFGLTPDSVTVINDQRLINLARAKVSGLDYQFAYGTETSIGALNFGVNGSYLFNFEEQSSPAVEPIETLNTVGNPIDLRLRANAGWSRDGYGVNLFVNHAGDYFSEAAGAQVPVDSWTTVDLNLSYDTNLETAASLLNGVRINLNIQNLFDEDPPFLAQSLTPGINFDGANANALGRTIALTVTKAW